MSCVNFGVTQNYIKQSRKLNDKSNTLNWDAWAEVVEVTTEML